VNFLVPHLRPGLHLLDVGCGPGSITCDLATLVAPGDVVGIDLQPSQAIAATTLATQRGVTNARFETGSIYGLPFPDEAFDIATASDIDGGATLVWPSVPAVLRLLDFNYRVVVQNGDNPYLGREHGGLLLEAGFAPSEVHPYARFYATLDQMYLAMREWGERPDSLLYEQFFGALGWVPS
jgi:ubiquinone/menaquinone biosynthesis C-methylase UbiE